MSEERLQEIKDSIDLQLTVAKSTKIRNELADEEKELYDAYINLQQENERLNNIINELEKRSEMLFKLEEFLQNKWERPAIQIYIGDVIKELENLGFYKIKRIKGAK